MRYHYSPTRRAKIQNTDNTQCWRARGAAGALVPGGGTQDGAAPLEDGLCAPPRSCWPGPAPEWWSKHHIQEPSHDRPDWLEAGLTGGTSVFLWLCLIR